MRRYMGRIRAASPGAGSYMNEGDPGEPEWQAAFFGAHYSQILATKRAGGPWGVFWAPTMVGSEAWEAVDADGNRDGVYPGSQNGRLCRTEAGGAY